MTRPCEEGCPCARVPAPRQWSEEAEAKESLARHERSLALDAEWLATLAERGGR